MSTIGNETLLALWQAEYMDTLKFLSTIPDDDSSPSMPVRYVWGIRIGTLSFSAKSSKFISKVAGGIQVTNSGTTLDSRFPDYCCVFLAEMTVFKVTIDILLRAVTSFMEVNTYSNSTNQALKTG